MFEVNLLWDAFMERENLYDLLKAVLKNLACVCIALAISVKIS